MYRVDDKGGVDGELLRVLLLRVLSEDGELAEDGEFARLTCVCGLVRVQ